MKIEQKIKKILMLLPVFMVSCAPAKPSFAGIF